MNVRLTNVLLKHTVKFSDKDGATRHYIDYNAFARSQLGSLNTTTIKNKV